MPNAPKILVIDDDPSIRSLLTDVLEVSGFAVRTAEDAVRQLGELNPPLAVKPLIRVVVQ